VTVIKQGQNIEGFYAITEGYYVTEVGVNTRIYGDYRDYSTWTMWSAVLILPRI